MKTNEVSDVVIFGEEKGRGGWWGEGVEGGIRQRAKPEGQTDLCNKKHVSSFSLSEIFKRFSVSLRNAEKMCRVV
jgi:hypothetical protein